MIFFPGKFSIKQYIIFVLSLFSLIFFSCTSVRNIPAGRPYVYETNVHVEGNLSKGEEKELTQQLQQQVHDSLQVRKVTRLIFWQTLDKPPVFDSAHVSESMAYMRALLHSHGYFRDSINFTVKVDSSSKTDLPAKIDFFVYPGVVTRIDSISYNLISDTLNASPRYRRELDTIQKITLNSLNEALVKKGDPFSKYNISAERDRLADVYRNNGYMRYSQEEMLVLWDTVGIALIRPTVDPIEQARQLAELRRRRENPTADIEFRLRSNPDSTRITRYYIGNITVYPDLGTDTSYNRSVTNIGDYRFVSYQNLFKPEKLTEYIFLRRGDLYRQSQELKTQNKFSSLGAWRGVAINRIPRPDDDTVDFEIRMTPAKKYAFNINLEGSRNQGNLSMAEGNLIGLGINFSLQNRNFARAANLATTNFRYGAELNATTANLVQTQQVSVSHNIQFPRMVPKIRGFFNPQKDNEVRSIFSLNLANTDRLTYYNLSTFNTSWGVEKSWRNKLLGIRLPNIEYNYLIRRDSLNKLIQANASYKYIFNTGFIISSLVNYSIAGGKRNISNLLSTATELPVLPFALRNDLYRFIKFDAEFRQTHKIRRSAFAWRLFGGAGYGMPFNSNDSINLYLPFFRAYYAGGPNSMRAWGVRKLGPGSALRSFNRTDAPDRFGDMRLEANAEYRFYLFEYGGILFNSALFTDMGNIWFLRENKDFPGGEFRLSKLGRDIAVGMGTGLRIDFGFLKVRFDYSYKVKDPSPEDSRAQNKWFYGWRWNKGQFQLGIDYPF